MESTRSNVIGDDCQVLIKKGKNTKLFRVRKGRDIFMENTKFSLDGAIGHPFGTTFEVIQGKLVKITAGNSMLKESGGKEASQSRDNRDLHDLDSNQKLSKEEIEQLKKDGVTGNDLVGQLVENSATFQKKTEYAQEKYIKKKKQKHVLEFTLLKPTTRLLCEMYRSKNSQKICNLRLDTLAQMLTYGNVHAGMTVAVVDTCMGLVLGSVMERLGGFGKVIQLYHGSTPNRTALDGYDFSSEIMKTLYSFPLNMVNSLRLRTDQGNGNEHTSNTDENTQNSSKEKESLETNTDVCDRLDSEKSDTAAEETDVRNGGNKSEISEKSGNKIQGKRTFDDTEKEEKKEKRAKEMKAGRELIETGQIDCLIVACKFHPTPIVTCLRKFVAPSRPVIVYSQFKEALMDCYAFLREDGGMVNFRLSETWLREYQVLPQRTHPTIQMSGTGGYLLTASTCINS